MRSVFVFDEGSPRKSEFDERYRDEHETDDDCEHNHANLKSSKFPTSTLASWFIPS